MTKAQTLTNEYLTSLDRDTVNKLIKGQSVDTLGYKLACQIGVSGLYYTKDRFCSEVISSALTDIMIDGRLSDFK